MMAVLANVSNFYIALLFLLFIGGVGVIFFNFLKKIWKSTEKFNDKKGNRVINKWLRLASVSFAGIMIAFFVLGLTNSIGGGSEHDHAAHAGGSASNISSPQAPGFASGPQLQNAAYPTSYSAENSMEVQLYQLQMSIMQLQQQLAFVMRMQANNQNIINQGMPGNINNSMGTGNNATNMGSSAAGGFSEMGTM